ncbi:MAG: tripartite tricarboxylate transporter substrate binding protein, partial [Clostridia bacterium]|nr:tripartite tricarboxylate transporter substrate binding protein [Clostridia bacterium]
MKKLCLVLVLVLMVSICGTALADWEPKQPITIMNHVAVGGAMDLYTRKWVELAAKYTNATFVVDNNDGASGLTAGEWVLGQD